MKIYHIASREAWIEATRNGSYSAPSLESEGFIHCSTAGQVLPVAREFYRGQAGLVLLVIDTSRLQPEIKWEVSATPKGVPEAATFPHVFGPIRMDAIVETLDFEPDGEGDFRMPALTGADGSERQA